MLKKLYPSLSLQQSLTITFVCFFENVRKLNTPKAFFNKNRLLIFIQIFFSLSQATILSALRPIFRNHTSE